MKPTESGVGRKTATSMSAESQSAVTKGLFSLDWRSQGSKPCSAAKLYWLTLGQFLCLKPKAQGNCENKVGWW